MAFLLILPLLGIFVSPALHAADKIRISVSGGYNMIFLPAGVAQHRGFFKDEGLDADIIVMGATPSIAALTNGEHRLHPVDRHRDSRGDPRAAGAPGRRTDDELTTCPAGTPGGPVD